MTQASFVIIGAGAFGLSTALHLARRRAHSDGHRHIGSILLLDSQPFPSIDSASNDTSRAVRPDYTDAFHAQLGLAAVSAWQTDATFRPHYHQTGRVSAARPHHADFIESCKREIGQLGLEAQVLTDGRGPGKSLCSRFPSLDGPVAGFHMYYNAHAGWAHPYKALLAAMDEFLRLGGRFIGDNVDGQVVSNLISSDGTVLGVRTASGTEHLADRVLYATGAYANEDLLPGLGTQIHPTGFAIAHWRLTEEERLAWKDHPVVDLYHHGYFFPPDETGLMKMGTGVMGFGFGSTQKKNAVGDVISGVGSARKNSELQGTRHEGAIPQEAEQAIRWILSQMAPKLAYKPFFNKKVCWDAMTPDGAWIIDEHPDVKNMFVAIGGSGHGFKFLPIVGSWIADILMDGRGKENGTPGSLPSQRIMRERWAWGRKKNMGVLDPSVALQGRPIRNIESALENLPLKL